MNPSLMTPRVPMAKATSPTNLQRNRPEFCRLRTANTSPHEIHNAKRAKSRPDPITLREVGVVIGLVAIGLRAAPRPMDAVVAFIIAPVYFLIRVYPFLYKPFAMIWVAVPFVPAWITGDPSDIAMAKDVLFLTAPTFARIVIWWDVDELWYVLDPLVIATAMPAVLAVAVLIGRLFQVGALAWN